MSDKNFKKLKKLLVISEIPDRGLFCRFHNEDYVHCERGRLSTKSCEPIKKSKKNGRK